MSNKTRPRTSETNRLPAAETAELSRAAFETLPKRYVIKAGIAEKSKSDYGASEDVTIFDKANGIFGVIDGMGGYAHGDVAANVAADAAYGRLTDALNLQPEDRIRSAMDAMRIAVRTRGQGGDAVGTVAKLYYDQKAEVLRVAYGHVGDTRMFHYAADTQEVTPVTEDQSTGNRVHSSIGHDKGIDQIGTIDVKPGDRIMICSDGITGDWQEQFLTPTEFEYAFSQDTPQDVAECFEQLSKKHDDKSVTVFQVEDLEAESATEIKPAVNEAEQRYQERQAKKAKKKAEAERAAAAAAAIAAASPVTPSPEAQELARMVADLKKDMLADASAEDAEEEEYQPAVKVTDRRTWKREAGDMRTPSTHEAAAATDADAEEGSASHQALVRMREQGQRIAEAKAGRSESVAPEEATESVEVASEGEAEPKAKLWTWKDMMRNPGATLGVIMTDYRRVRAERQAAEAEYGDEAKILDKHERRRRNIVLGAIGIATAIMAVRTGIELAQHAGGSIDIASAGGFAGSDPDLNPHHQYTFNHHDVAQAPTHASAPAPKLEIFTGTGGSTELTQGGLNNAHEWLQGHKVQQGETIWGLAEQYLKAHGMPTDVYSIDAMKDGLLPDFQKRGLANANGWLRAGQTLKF